MKFYVLILTMLIYQIIQNIYGEYMEYEIRKLNPDLAVTFAEYLGDRAGVR